MKTIVSIVFFLYSICVSSQDWKETYAEALAQAVDENKPIVLVFAGSDWCAPCIKLDKTIWQSSEFKSYASENFVLYKADFPRKKANKLPEDLAKQNAALADRFNQKGHFPLVVVLDSEEKILGKTGYKKLTPEAYVSLLNTFIK